MPADALQTLKKCLTLNNPKVSAEAGRLAGDLAFELKMYPQASQYYNVVMTKYTASEHLGPAITGAFWALYEQKQYGQMLAAFEQYKKHLNNHDRVTGWYLAGASYQAMGDHNQASALFGAILAAAAGSDLEDKVLYRLAASQFEIGQFGGMTQTIAKLRKAFPQSSRLADAGYLLATAALKQGDNNLAAARLSAIIDSGQRHPFYTQALLQRARLYENISQYDHAVADYETYAAVYPSAENQVKLPADTIAQAMVRLVDLNYQIKRFEAADQSASKLLELENLDPLIEAEGLYRRGLSQVQMKQFQTATATLSTLLDKYPQNHYRADAIYYRGLLQLALKQPDKALADLHQAASIAALSKPLKINALRLVSILQRQAELSVDAAETLGKLEKIVGLTGMNVKELVWLGQYLMGQKKPVDAMRYLKPILEGNKQASRGELSKALMLAAQSLREQNQLPQAIDTFREVVAMSQGHGYQARIELARTLAKANRHNEALDEYESLIAASQTRIACQALYDSGELHRQLVQIRLRESDAAGARQQREAAVMNFKRLVLLFTFPEVSPLPHLANIQLAEL
ncbi:MAG: tetratricopeptide repeat protein, partial [Phycisphaeraceae bacterium]|nr:tetratricopeptide repeat protein [Phycisphaeraceae bacterium]